eukprot:jgi/Tetstr1/426976/TSEL_017189.t1
MRPRGSEQVSTAKGPRAASSARKTSPSRRQSWLAVDCAPKPGEAVGEGVLPAWDVTGDERDDVALQEFEKSREQLEGVRGVTPPEESARAAGSTLHGMQLHNGLTTIMTAYADAKEHHKDIYTVYFDFKGAFDSTDHEILFKTMTNMGMSTEYISV